MAKANAKDLYWAVWPTAWGAMGGVSGAAGLRRVVLPHYQPNDLRDLLAWEHPGAKESPDRFEQLIGLSRDYFNARPADFAVIECDLPSPGSFSGMVLRACREIPRGRTESYSSLALRIGRPDSARAVATAMSKNPMPLVIPCHRVIYANGRAGGFSAAGGEAMKQRMLNLEKSAGK